MRDMLLSGLREDKPARSIKLAGWYFRRHAMGCHKHCDS